MKSIATMLLCLIYFVSPCRAATGPATQSGVLNHGNTALRVLLAKQLQNAEVNGLDGDLYLSEEAPSSWRRLGKTVKIISRRGTGFLVNGNVINANSFYLRGKYPNEPLRFQAAVFRNTLKITQTGNSFLVTNLLSIEQYLVGTVSSEMHPTWEMEALKAQVVASRSYALYMMKHPRNALYDLEKGVQDQVYSGALEESQRVRLAVASTVGQYLTFGSAPLKAHYHSRCGGTTESPTSVWQGQGQQAHYQRVECPFCRKHPYSWTASFSLSEFLRGLSLKPTGSELELKEQSRLPSGRLAVLEVGTGDHTSMISADDLRSRLGYQKIKSTLFDWVVKGKNIIFNGVGMGHGVGMCQWGARYLAQTGKSYRQILAHYYPGIPLAGTSIETSSRANRTWR